MTQQERAVRTRNAVLRAAGEVFDELGYEAATISAILQRAKVTKGALYFHFSSKEELAQAVLTRQLTSVPRVPGRDLALQQGLDEALVLAHMLAAGEPLVRGSVRLTVEQGSPQDGLDRRASMEGWIEHNVEILSAARDNGELLPSVDVAAAAKMFVGAFTGVQILSKVMTDRADLVERVADLQRHLMAGVAVPAVLVQLDFSPERGAQVYEEAATVKREAEPVAVD
ncbi:ScbR family autoregulator-binding transcription factor [Streptomyces sp. DSM 41972]|uniref:ScbR family autoregulator-binding transcription factor n=1 Tax=Streptomyces althioticus subsp. attaecolombicae TaxID=3075534 RepID=A0ABU3I6P7_9ACTN|nr:ScbR family autoregulator-binding transcription factor [Streptomyces sp. DSM 41972]SCD48020.1 transcriptional regulator, TetR family [Streptomyces sp. di50b]SCE51806.1 transcriptional regulator, TetR family [Streptomyces sp. di188]